MLLPDGEPFSFHTAGKHAGMLRVCKRIQKDVFDDDQKKSGRKQVDERCRNTGKKDPRQDLSGKRHCICLEESHGGRVQDVAT